MRAVGFVAGVLVSTILTAALAAASARAAVDVLDATGRDVDARDGMVVWARDAGAGTVLMRRVGKRVSRIPGVRAGFAFPELDLGRNAHGRVVATYRRCGVTGHCRGPFVVDVRRGGERRLVLHVPGICLRPRSASLWGAKVAYLLSCPSVRHTGGRYVLGNRRTAHTITSGPPYTLSPAPRDLVANVFVDVTLPGQLWMATIGKLPTCQGPVARVEGSGAVLEDVAIVGRRVWWLRQDPVSAGGRTTTLLAATMHRDCTVTPGDARDLTSLVGDHTADSFAVDRGILYLAVKGMGALQIPLSQLG